MARPKKTATKKNNINKGKKSDSAENPESGNAPRVEAIESKRIMVSAAKPHRRVIAKASSAEPHQSSSRTALISMLKNSAETNASNGTRRPPNNPDVPQTLIDMLNHDLNGWAENS